MAGTLCCHACYIYHLFTEIEGYSVFCWPETAVVAQGKAEDNNSGQGLSRGQHTASVLLYSSLYKCQSMNNLPVIGVNFETKTRQM
jgi:hypothetical protein